MEAKFSVALLPKLRDKSCGSRHPPSISIVFASSTSCSAISPSDLAANLLDRSYRSFELATLEGHLTQSDWARGWARPMLASRVNHAAPANIDSTLNLSDRLVGSQLMSERW